MRNPREILIEKRRNAAEVWGAQARRATIPVYPAELITEFMGDYKGRNHARLRKRRFAKVQRLKSLAAAALPKPLADAGGPIETSAAGAIAMTS